LGHALSLMKFAEFQKLGHKVIMLIGSFTAMIGDPTDKMATRKPLTRKQVLENAKKYKKQAATFLNFSGPNKAEIKYNHKWFDKMNFKEVVDLSANFTVQQMLERDMFDKRVKEGKPVSLHEFLYPVMQAYDSVAMNVDGEIGGNDQTFNMLAGRTLMKSLQNKEKFVVTNKLLADPTGKKMGKSEGNMITLDDSASEKFGKVMSWTDGMIVPAFELCTYTEKEKVNEIKLKLENGENPRNAKILLAKEIVKIYHSEEESQTEEQNFVNKFAKKEIPNEIEEFDLAGKTIIEVLVEAKLVNSNSEARRAVEQNGVSINQEKVTDIKTEVKAGDIIQKGKRFFVRIK
jgi:tyrosyl-tRNA synthetase